MATRVTEYVSERFLRAVENLATMSGQIQERLLQAMMDLVVIDPEEIPKELRDEYVSIKRETTARDAVAGEGTLQATIYSMADDEAVAIAKRLVAMQRRILELHYGIE